MYLQVRYSRGGTKSREHEIAFKQERAGIG